MTLALFTRIGGFLSLGVGIVGILFPRLLGEALWFDVTEDVVHTAFGLALLAAGFVPSMASMRRPFVAITAASALIAGIIGLIVMSQPPLNVWGLTNLEHPLDNILHFGFGLWALAVLLSAENSAAISR
jgi:hypothetical protein